MISQALFKINEEGILLPQDVHKLKEIEAGTLHRNATPVDEQGEWPLIAPGGGHNWYFRRKFGRNANLIWDSYLN